MSVKAEYLIAIDKDTQEEVQVQMIPPEPEGSDLGGLTKEERDKIAKNETLDVEVHQTNSRFSSTHTFDEIMTAYSAGRDVRVRFNTDNYAGKEFIMHHVGNSTTKVEFHTVMELSDKLIFIELECDNQDNWDMYSKQYLQSDSYYLAVENGAGAHNSVYRGKNLGTKITDEQLARISDGTFKDLFIGDYWEISGVKYVIADFDYMYNAGDTAVTKHHILVLPERNMYTYQMNTENTTANGYMGSKMYESGLDAALQSFKNAFGETHVLQYRNLLVNATSGANPTNWAWVNRQIDLMNEAMIYGQRVWRISGYDVGVQKRQLALFQHRHDAIQVGRSWYWLRDVYSATGFADVNSYGSADYHYASLAEGVRPFALIG